MAGELPQNGVLGSLQSMALTALVVLKKARTWISVQKSRNL
jgi:hypothetical protein